MPFTSSTSIAQQILIGPIDPLALWMVLTDSDATPYFFLRCSFKSDFEPGSPYTLSVGDTVLVDGVIIEYEPPTNILMTFNQHWNHEISEPASRVLFHLEPRDPLVEFIVVHDRLVEGSPLNAELNASWTLMTSALKTLVETNGALPLRAEEPSEETEASPAPEAAEPVASA